MEMRIMITDTEAGATISVLSSSVEWSKAYASWEEALDAALRLDLMSVATHQEAKSLPPAFPYCGNATVKRQQLAAAGFICHQRLAA